MALKLIKEGAAKLNIYAEEKVSKKLLVFYNPVMKFNRDISVLLLRAIKKNKLKIAFPLAGTGVRGIRFILELPKNKIKSISFNDLNPKAPAIIKQNLKLNKINNNKISVYNKDANEFLLSSKGFDYIDIDPFGSPCDYLNSSIKRLSRNGILAVTATDTGCLAGSFPETCQRKYWAKPLKNEFMHETGLRILIRKVQLIGSQFNKALTPIFSYAKEHYYRTFLQCEKGRKKANKVSEEHGYIIYCKDCLYRVITKDIFNNRNCPFCKNELDYAGALWLGELWNEELVSKMIKLNLSHELTDFLHTISEESKIPQVSFYNIHELCKKHNKGIIPKKAKLIEETKKQSKCSETHFDNLGFRSDIRFDRLKRLLNTSLLAKK